MCNDDMDVEDEEDVQAVDVPALDSMSVVSIPEVDTTWVENMQVNNDPLEYDFGGAEADCVDNDEPEMEILLDDDLCSAQIMAKSIVANVNFNSELFLSCSVQTGFKVGMVFESKAKFLQQLSEWSILHAVSFKPIRSNKSKIYRHLQRR